MLRFLLSSHSKWCHVTHREERREVLPLLLPAWSPALCCSPAPGEMTRRPLSRAGGPTPSGRCRTPSSLSSFSSPSSCSAELPRLSRIWVCRAH